MKRGKPLARSKPLRRGRLRKAAQPRRVTRPGPGSDPAYLAKVRKLPCCAPRISLVGPEALMHEGDVVAHHAGRKTNDSTAVALCWKHHGQWHDLNGVFKGWNKEQRRYWASAAIDDTRRIILEDSEGGVLA